MIEPISPDSHAASPQSPTHSAASLAARNDEVPAATWFREKSDVSDLRLEPDTQLKRLERQYRGLLKPDDIAAWNIDSFPRTIASSEKRRFGVGEGLDVGQPTLNAKGQILASELQVVAHAARKQPALIKPFLNALQLTARRKTSVADLPQVIDALCEDVAAGRPVLPLEHRGQPPQPLEALLTPTKIRGKHTYFGRMRVRTEHADEFRKLAAAWHALDPEGARAQLQALHSDPQGTNFVFDGSRDGWWTVPPRYTFGSYTIFGSTTKGQFQPQRVPLSAAVAKSAGVPAQATGALVPRHLLFAHEIQHRLTSMPIFTGLEYAKRFTGLKYGDYHSGNEIIAMAYENRLSEAAKLIPRADHRGVLVTMPNLDAHEIRLPFTQNGDAAELRPGQSFSGRVIGVDPQRLLLQSEDGIKATFATAHLLDAVRPLLGSVVPLGKLTSLHTEMAKAFPKEGASIGKTRRGFGFELERVGISDARQMALWKAAAKAGDQLEITVMPDYGSKTHVTTQSPVNMKLAVAADSTVRVSLSARNELRSLRILPLPDGGIRIIRRKAQG